MATPKRSPPQTFTFTGANLEHLEALIKLLERSHRGMPPVEVALMLQSMLRLRSDVCRSGVTIAEAPF